MLKVETGYQTSTAPSITRTTVSVVDTLYTPCGCSPLGKTWKVSLPHAPGGTVYWTEYVYDALGNLIKVTEPNPAGGDNLETTYTYSGAVGSNVYNRYSGIVLTEGNDPAGFGNYVIVDIGFGDLMLYQSGSITVQVGGWCLLWTAHWSAWSNW